ncbi:glycosyltransferase family 2 protein [Donghicola sp. C2-DW-16]|uniref:Glycosyltransferase family 2 protein n=1 Tax=Donghicola mangrovi TaxID=2729614 RepID=A0ABX2PI58_9RHOB|nr:glycosyltransferase [Donghicola mangrovi]NVO29200.1 glycosyltransferase family 2 protein [Donghicola mangrovi]
MTISVIMANFNGGKYIAKAIASVQRQSTPDWELLVCDDFSSDNSAEIAIEASKTDSRIRLISSQCNRGASAARNMGLAAAKGDWIAIVDSDDLIHPERLARMRHFAEMGHPLLADDLVFISDTPAFAGRTLLEELALTSPQRFDLAQVLLSDTPKGRFSSLGYTKLFFSRSLSFGIKYNENLKVSEDFEFLIRLLIRAQGLWVLPEPSYLYRRHKESLSYRTSIEIMLSTIKEHQNMLNWLPLDAGINRAYFERKVALDHLLAFEYLVDHIKHCRIRATLKAMIKRPQLIEKLILSLRERYKRNSTHSHVPDRMNFKALGFSMNAPSVSESWQYPPCRVAASLSAGERTPEISEWFSLLAREMDFAK